MRERLENKLSSWKGKKLSWSGMATLIKSVAQAILVYSMTAFQFPKNICEQLVATIRRFWWNPKSKFGSYWTSISWSSLCRLQKEGGLGFRKFWDFNQALLSKLAWWVLFGKDCLCIEVLRAKYKVRHNWLNQAPHSNTSPVWKSYWH